MRPKIITRQQLVEVVPYSLTHIARLEVEGHFPRRVKLGPCRVGWVESEVLDWLNERLAERAGR
jgi:prophage regulatory protein